MGTRLTVTCANIGTKWHPVWVERLYNMVEEHCSMEFDFRCITDRPELYPDWGVPFSRELEYVDRVYRQPNRNMVMNIHKPQGAWAKCDIFLPTFGPGPIINFDLDIVILDDIAPLVRKQLHMPWQGEKHNGSIYSFTPDVSTEAIYPRFIPYERYPRGEQEYVVDAYGPVRDLEDCYSYKIHVACRGGKIPPGARVIYFHGYPTPADDKIAALPWVRPTWEGLQRIQRQ